MRRDSSQFSYCLLFFLCVPQSICTTEVLIRIWNLWLILKFSLWPYKSQDSPSIIWVLRIIIIRLGDRWLLSTLPSHWSIYVTLNLYLLFYISIFFQSLKYSSQNNHILKNHIKPQGFCITELEKELFHISTLHFS